MNRIPAFRGLAIFEQISAAPAFSGAQGPSRQRGQARRRVRGGNPVQLVRGRTAVAALQPELAALAARCGQTGEADHLLYFLSTPDALRKTPCLLLGYESHPFGLRAGSVPALAWAALVFEYRLPLPGRLGGTRLYASADSTGRRNVLAPPHCRVEVSALAARTLIERGAHIVHIAFNHTHDCGAAHTAAFAVEPDEATEGAAAGGGNEAVLEIAATLRGSRRVGESSELQTGQPDTHRPEPHRPEPRRHTTQQPGSRSWTLHEQSMPLYLPLLETLDATLGRIGQKTRFNLRYYRRRAEQDLRAEFVPDIAIEEEAFVQFNRRCTYAVPDGLARQRYRSLGRTPGNPHPRSTFLCGMRDSEGEWLSLVGGRRMNAFVEIDWQMNRADLPSYSLSTAMRSFLIDAEIERGSTRLYIEGGTPHPIARSFVQERVGELTVKRRSAYVALLERLSLRIFPVKNYLAQTLRNPGLVWRDW